MSAFRALKTFRMVLIVAPFALLPSFEFWAFLMPTS
jgi:hypothetical protein